MVNKSQLPPCISGKKSINFSAHYIGGKFCSQLRYSIVSNCQENKENCYVLPLGTKFILNREMDWFLSTAMIQWEKGIFLKLTILYDQQVKGESELEHYL